MRVRKRPAWLNGLDNHDWLFDGYPIRGTGMVARWNALDWKNAHVDMGPSVSGNPGPYWHVPLPEEGTVHRLYPKLLKTKWLNVIERAVDECVARALKPPAVNLPAATPPYRAWP